MTSLEILNSKKKLLCQPSVKKELFTAEHMSIIQRDLNLSTRSLNVLTQDLRLATGKRKIIEKNMQEKVMEKNHSVDDLFDQRKLIFHLDIKEKKTTRTEKVEEHVVVCNNVAALIDRVLENRQIDRDSAINKFGFDGGRGFVKICLSTFDLAKFSEKGGGLGNKHRDSGVKKVLIIALVPNTSENYFNMKCLWLNLNLHLFNRPYTIATDLKLCNVLLGLQSHSSMHPCCWCDADKYNLHEKGFY